jgi:sugar phosphate permease
MAKWFSPSRYGTAMGAMTISYQLGGVVATVFAGALIKIGLGWRGVFFVPAAVLAAIGLLGFFLLRSSPKDLGFELPADDRPAAAPIVDPPDVTTYLQRFTAVLSRPVFWLMMLLSVVLTFERETFNTWMPAYFSDLGSASSAAAFKSAVFPLLGCVGTLAAGWLTDRYLGGRRVPLFVVSLAMLAACLFGLAFLPKLAAVPSDVGVAAASVAGLAPGTWAVVLVGAAGFFLLAPYSMIGGGVVALDFGGRRTSGTAAGLLDGVGYLGATASGVGVAQLVMNGGWTSAFSLMGVLTLVAVSICFLLLKLAPAS